MIIEEILIINQPLGNRGDESAHRALVRSLNRVLPSVHITVLTFMDWTNGIADFVVDSPNNEYIRFLFPHNIAAEPTALFLIKHGLTKAGTLLHPVLRRLIPYYKRADLVLSAPGGICMGGFQNWKHMFMLQMARDMNKPIVYYSRSIGPFPTITPLNRKFKSLATDMLNEFQFLSLRDWKSKCIAKEMGISYVSAIDTAFLEQPRCEIPEELNNCLKDDYVVFVPNQLTWHYAYKGLSQQLINNFYLGIMEIIHKAYPMSQIVMLPQLCSNIGSYSDYPYFKKLQSLAKGYDIFVVPDTYGSDIQQTIISKSRCVIGSRYHTIVFAINNEAPFVALNYEHKIAGLLEELNLSANIVNIADAFADEASVSRKLTEFSSVLKQAKQICPSRDIAHQMASDCFDKLIKYINNPQK